MARLRLLGVTTCLIGMMLAAGQAFGQGPEPGFDPLSHRDDKVFPWQGKLHEQIPLLGHRNWIVIADSAYPAQIAPGIVTVVANYTPLLYKPEFNDDRGKVPSVDEHMYVVEYVLNAVDKAPHVAGAIFTDAELPELKEDVVPGINEFRTDLAKVLKGRNVTSKLHEDIIADLDEAGSAFRIFVIKTDLTLPFTSVFIRLDCQYWTPEMDAQLREAMSKK